MSTNPSGKSPIELYVSAMERTKRYVAGVRPDQWTGPTPCTDWNVRQLVGHIVSENLWAAELFKEKTMAEVGDRLDGDLLGSDPKAAYDNSVQVAKATVEAPSAMEAVCHVSYGDISGANYAGDLFTDLLIHGWDIAKATGQDTTLDPDLVAVCYARVEPIKDDLRASGAFGSDIQVAPDADLQTKLLALLGRQA